MMNKPYDNDWIDRYLRNTLSDQDEADFETALLQSVDLQRAVENVLCIRQALRLQQRTEAANPVVVGNVELVESAAPGKTSDRAKARDDRRNWGSAAMVATVVLGVFSTTAWWQSSQQVAVLQDELAVLSQPRTDVLTVPIDIMRSGGGLTPDAVIEVPVENSVLVLDVELGMQAAGQDKLLARFRDLDRSEIMAWVTGPVENGRIKLVFDAPQMPQGTVWLELSSKNDELLDKRLLEFR